MGILAKIYNEGADQDFELGLLMLDKTSQPMMQHALHAYSDNVLTYDTLAIETQSHEFPLDVIMAAKYDPVIEDTDNEKLKRGISRCYQLWDQHKLRLDELTIPLVNELSSSYLAGGVGTEDQLTSNVNSMQNIMKDTLLDEGFNDREILEIYHHFLKDKFTDGEGNVTYSPDPRIQMLILNKKYRTLSSYVAYTHTEDSAERKKLGNLFKADHSKIGAYAIGTQYQPEWEALRFEQQRLETLISLTSSPKSE